MLLGTAVRLGRHNALPAARFASSPHSTYLYQGHSSFLAASATSSSFRTMTTIVNGVEFDTLAREWRCKWSADNDKKSLEEAQAALNEILADLKGMDGVIRVDRVVCGSCNDFKVITSLPAGPKWEAWEGKKHAPEESFLEKLKSIDGLSQFETQTYTFMAM